MALTPDGRAIEKVLATLNERGINVVETEEAEADEKEEETREKRGNWVKRTRRGHADTGQIRG
jgi:hypothetical protein